MKFEPKHTLATANRFFLEEGRNFGSSVLTLSIQPYLDQAEVNRQKYMKEVEKYQKSDHYKKYLQTVAGTAKSL